MKTYNFKEAPLSLHGFTFNAEGKIIRMPEEIAERVNETTKNRNYNAVGGRVRFKTNSDLIVVKTKLSSNKVDWAIPLSGSAGADVFAGVGEEARWIGVAAPHDYVSLEGEGWCFKKNNELENITINLPRNEPLVDLEICINDDAIIEPADDYTNVTPIVYYGSSITEGGCATSPGNAYTSLVSRWLDSEYINLGFSNAAHGEEAMAEHITSLEMNVFVMDYDHNAANAEELKNTHEKFFKAVRAARPELPVVFMTKPDFDGNKAENAVRRDIVKATYENAKASGDKLVWFVDGESYFGNDNRSICTVEGCHPNDLGFMRMAKAVYPVIKQALANK